jgi:hypothetical protein
MAREIDLLKPLEITRIRDAKLPADARVVAEAIAAARGLKATGAGGSALSLRLSDGRGLYLQVDPSGAARWLFLFRWGGKLKEMGLGSLAKVTLKTAREKADTARELIGLEVKPDRRQARAGGDPDFRSHG